MPQDKKFIIVKDKETADKFIASGFKFIGESSGAWTFINAAPQNFCFEEIDKTKFVYTNVLSL